MIREIISIYFLISGCIFFLTTGIAMLRFSDLYARLHAGSKCLYGGAVSLLLAYLLQANDLFVALKVVLIVIFLLITNPIATHALARAAYNQNCYVGELHHDEYGGISKCKGLTEQQKEL